jgi:hypothetical protein
MVTCETRSCIWDGNTQIWVKLSLCLTKQKSHEDVLGGCIFVKMKNVLVLSGVFGGRISSERSNL